MRILLTNDDGMTAPGLQALYRALESLGDIAVVAPETAQSGVGHGISVHGAITAKRVQVNGLFEGWSIDGRPADCVRLALQELLEQRPDFVISGINAGLNTGMYMLYSGTVAGASEASVFFGLPSMAVSLELTEKPDFELAGRIARAIFERYAAGALATASCINVNIPSLESGPPEGIRICPHTVFTADARYRRKTDGDGREIFWFDGGQKETRIQPKCDFEAIRGRSVSITPLKFDVTDRRLLAEMSKWDWPERFDWAED